MPETPRETNVEAAKQACLATYRTAIATRRANCNRCNDDGMRLDSAGTATRDRCTHPSSRALPADLSPADPTRKGTR